MLFTTIVTQTLNAPYREIFFSNSPITLLFLGYRALSCYAPQKGPIALLLPLGRNYYRQALCFGGYRATGRGIAEIVYCGGMGH